MKDVDAVILVGGQGTRLRPLTLSAPKPMLPTAGLPFLAHLLSRIAEAGMRHVILGTSYRAEVFEKHFSDGSELGLEIEYVIEREPLGTGGGIRNVLPALRYDTAMIFNGDVLSGVNLGAVHATHLAADADVTLYLTRVQDPRAFGCVSTTPDGRVTAFLEKDPNPVTDQINAGTYVFKRSVIETIPAGRPVSVERDTFPHLLSSGARVFAHVDDKYWRDLGTPADFVAGSADLVRGLAPSAALRGTAGEAIVLPGAEVSPSAILENGTTVGANCVIEAGAVIDGSVLFDDAHIEAAAIIRRSVIGRGARIGAGTVVQDAVIGDGAKVGARNELLAGARIWPGAVIADVSIRFSSET
jgi:mannose-1-phosphate guanylyltransferase